MIILHQFLLVKGLIKYDLCFKKDVPAFVESLSQGVVFSNIFLVKSRLN